MRQPITTRLIQRTEITPYRMDRWSEFESCNVFAVITKIYLFCKHDRMTIQIFKQTIKANWFSLNLKHFYTVTFIDLKKNRDLI